MIETPDSKGRATRPRKVETVVVKVIEGYARLNPVIKIDVRRGVSLFTLSVNYG